MSVCRSTHADPRCQASCAVVALCVAAALRGELGTESGGGVEEAIAVAAQRAEALLEPTQRVELQQYCAVQTLDSLKLDEGAAIGFAPKTLRFCSTLPLPLRWTWGRSQGPQALWFARTACLALLSVVAGAKCQPQCDTTLLHASLQMRATSTQKSLCTTGGLIPRANPSRPSGRHFTRFAHFMTSASLCIAIRYTYKCMAAGLYGLRSQQSFERTITELVEQGGDADTNGAV